MPEAACLSANGLGGTQTIAPSLNKPVRGLLSSDLSLQASTSGPQPELPRGSRRTSFGQQPKSDPPEKPTGEQQSTEWNFRVMTYNILAEGLVSLGARTSLSAPYIPNNDLASRRANVVFSISNSKALICQAC